jgi:hypothetical protein
VGGLRSCRLPIALLVQLLSARSCLIFRNTANNLLHFGIGQRGLALRGIHLPERRQNDGFGTALGPETTAMAEQGGIALVVGNGCAGTWALAAGGFLAQDPYPVG